MLETSALKLFIVANLHYQPSWFVSSVGRMLHRHRRGHGFKSLTGLNFFFSGLIFTSAQAVFITAKIAFIFTSLSAVQISDFHIFTVVYYQLS